MTDRQPAAERPLVSVLDQLGFPEGRLRRLAGLGSVAALGYRAGAAAYGQARARTSWSVAIDREDEAYPEIHRWLLDQIPPRRRRALTAHTRSARRSTTPAASDSGASRAREDAQALHYQYDSTKAQIVTLDGHRIRVALDREQGSAMLGSDSMPSWAKPRETIRFTAQSEAGRIAIHDFLTRVVEDLRRSDRIPRFYMARWGGWELRSDLPTRSLETIVLGDGQLEQLTGDLEQFLAEEATYARLGLPWHRGYLLHGPPGTGKTSVARGLATHFGLDLYFAPLSDLRQDTSLLQLVASVPAGAILLLEDIDVLTAAARDRHDRSVSTEGVTLSGLLNALDGVGTPHGLITVMTTNDPGCLDSALLRPGRIDCRVAVDCADGEQIARLWRLAFGSEPDRELMVALDATTTEHRVSPAAVLAALKPHLSDQAEGRAALLDLVHHLEGHE